MKASIFYKFKAFSYPTAQKITFYQQWNPLRKLSRPNKRIFRGRNRLFSIDSSRPLPKEIFLKIVHSLERVNVSLKDRYITSFKSEINLPPQCKKFNFLSYHLVNSLRKTYSWNIFRYIFLKKMWILSNPSLVPGIARPFRFKKMNIIKIRALKGLTHLIGSCNLQFIFFLVKKSWNMPNQVVPFFWNLPRTVDSLKSNVFLKLGLVHTIPITRELISRQKVYFNGFVNTKVQHFVYPGDYLRFNLQNFICQDSIFRVRFINKEFFFSDKLSREIIKKTKKSQNFYFKK